MPSKTLHPYSRMHTPLEDASLMVWIARIGAIALTLALTITLIVFMGDAMASVLATG